MRDRRVLASVLAVVATAGAVLLRALLSRWLGFELPFITFFGAVMAAAWYGGLFPGLLATVLSAFAALYWFMTPAWSLAMTQPVHVIGIVLFVLTGTLISVAAERLLSARQQIELLRVRDQNERSAANRARSLLAAVVESSEDAILTKSLQGTILSWNAGAEQMFGYPAAEVVGSHVGLIVPASRRDEEADILTRVSRGERVPAFETERVARDGTVLDVSVTLSPIRGDSGGSSARRQSSATSAPARRSKGRCARPIAARTTSWRCSPTSCAIRWRRSATASPCCSWERRRRRSARSPRRDRAADSPHGPAARRPARRLADHPRHASSCAASASGCATVIDARARDHPAAVRRRRAVASPSTLPPEPVRLDGDPVRLAQVFANILSNASKYSDRGGRVTIDATAGAAARWWCAVTDDGHRHRRRRCCSASSRCSRRPRRRSTARKAGWASAWRWSGAWWSCTAAASPRTAPGRGAAALHRDAAAAADRAGSRSRGRAGERRRRGAGACWSWTTTATAPTRLAMVLRAHGLQRPHRLRRRRTALTVAGSFQPHAMLLDIGMPGLDGYDDGPAPARRDVGSGALPGRGDRLGPGARPPADHRGRLRRPPGQAGGRERPDRAAAVGARLSAAAPTQRSLVGRRRRATARASRAAGRDRPRGRRRSATRMRADVPDVGERVGVEHEQIGDLAGLDRAEVAAAGGEGAVARSRRPSPASASCRARPAPRWPGWCRCRGPASRAWACAPAPAPRPSSCRCRR